MGACAGGEVELEPARTKARGYGARQTEPGPSATVTQAVPAGQTAPEAAAPHGTSQLLKAGPDGPAKP